MENKKSYLIQTLILSLNLSQIRKGIESLDYSSALKICLEHHFYNALIYLCTESDNNFMIPLIQIFSNYLFQKEKCEEKNEAEVKKIGYR